MSVASFLQNIPLVGQSLSDVASGHLGNAVSDLPIVGAPLGELSKGNVEGFFGALPLVGPALSNDFQAARDATTARALNIAGAKQEQQATSDELQRAHNERVARTAASVAKRITGAGGELSPDRADLLRRTFGGLLKGDESKQAFNDALDLSNGDFQTAAELFSKPSASSGGGGTAASIQAFNQIVSDLTAAGTPPTPRQRAQLLSDIVRGATFSEAGPGIFTRNQPVRLPGDSQTGITPVQPQLPPNPSAGSTQPTSLTDQVASAEGEVAGSKKRAENIEAEIEDYRQKIPQLNQLDNTFAQFEALLKAGVKTGPTQALLLPLRKVAVDLGALSPKEAKEVNAQQAFEALANRTALLIRSPNSPVSGGLPGNTSNRDLSFLKNSVPALGGTVEGNLLITQGFRNSLKRAKDTAIFVENFARQNGRKPTIQEIDQWDSQQPSILPEGFQQLVTAQQGSSAQGSDEDLAAFRSAF